MDWVLYERKLRHKGVNLILDHVLRNIIDYRNINKKHRLTEEVVTSKKSIPEALWWLPEILSEKNQSCNVDSFQVFMSSVYQNYVKNYFLENRGSFASKHYLVDRNPEMNVL